MYKGQEFNVFISYRGNSEGGLLGSKIYSDLLHYTNNNKEKEFKPFFAPACIPKGEDFKSIIGNVLEDVKCFIMILNNTYFDDCIKDDDMVFYELVQALANEKITFIPIIFNDFKFAEQKEMLTLFETQDINRFRHINPINYHGIYDFKTEIDLVPVLLTGLKTKITINKDSNIYRLELDNFRTVSNKKITFGHYPQSVISDINLIEKIGTGVFSGDTKLNPNTNMLSFRNQNYATITENPFNKAKFDNGKIISAGARNYYLSEPIVWNVLFENSKHQFLITEKTIDAVQFNLSRMSHRLPNNKTLPANNWQSSYIRRWLNNEFFYDAFSEDERNTIQTVELDNSNQSSNYPSTSENTIDNIFLISHQEIFLAKCAGIATTDFARAKGAYSSTSASHYGKGDWWTRSPGVTNDSVENIDRRGCVDALPFCNFVDDTAASVRPCIIIKKHHVKN